MDIRQQLTVLAASMVRGALSGDASVDAPASEALATRLRVDGVDGALAICPLFDVAALASDGASLAAKVGLEERLHAYGARDVAVWVPPGAALPVDADQAAGIIAEAARDLEPGARGEAAFKVDIAVRKTGSDGSYMSVLGGLSQHWAKFTNQVMGEYQLDSSNIHRLPESAAQITQMVDFLVLVANGIRSDGATTTVTGEDTWRIQRITGLEEPMVLCAPPTSVVDGRAVRRLMRRSLREAEEAANAVGGEFRIAAMITLAPGVERELASTALRGIDPQMLAGWTYAPLLVDGRLKPLLEASAPLA